MAEHFDVALSFASEDRAYVHTVAMILRQRGVAVFYDEFSTVELWGHDLYSYLDDIYRNKSRYAVMFASASYARSVWTSHERQSIQARVLVDSKVFLLPVRLDGTDIPGLRPTVAYLDGQRLGEKVVADLIIEKIGASRVGADLSVPAFRVPLTTDDRRRVLAVRPSGWEHLILAGTLWQEWQRLEGKRLDHELCFAAGTGRHVSAGVMRELLHIRMDELMATVSKLERVITGGRFEWAMGAPGVPGDAVRIEHLGHRFGTAVEELLDWAARVRATVCDPSSRTALELLAAMADGPMRGVAAFVQAMVTVAGQIADGASSLSTVDLRVIVTLELSIEPASIDAFNREIVQLGPRG